MTRFLLCLLSITIVAAQSLDVSETNRTLGAERSGNLRAGSGVCTGGINSNWVLASTKWDLSSAEISKKSRAIKTDTVNNMDPTTYAYQMESLVTSLNDIDLEM